MPSKTKKHSKTQSRLSTSEAATPPRTPPLTPNIVSEVNEGDLIFSCEEASRKFPSLIGKSAFIGEVSDVDVEPTSKGCKIWLSESSMVASSIAPGSIVSVSIASSRNRSQQSNCFPLKSLANECVICYGLEIGKAMDDEAGHYFSLATVFPSSKVTKNGVQLSSNLCYTMGCPTARTTVFVYPVKNQHLPCLANGNYVRHSPEDDCLLVYNCRELYLQLDFPENGLPMKTNILSSMHFTAAKSHV